MNDNGAWWLDAELRKAMEDEGLFDASDYIDSRYDITEDDMQAMRDDYDRDETERSYRR